MVGLNEHTSKCKQRNARGRRGVAEREVLHADVALVGPGVGGRGVAGFALGGLLLRVAVLVGALLGGGIVSRWYEGESLETNANCVHTSIELRFISASAWDLISQLAAELNCKAYSSIRPAVEPERRPLLSVTRI